MAHFTLFGINIALMVVNSKKCSQINIDMVAGINIKKNNRLISLIKKNNHNLNFLTKKDFKVKYLNNRSHSIAISFYYNLVKYALAGTFENKHSCFLALDGIQDPQNFGQIIRTAECAGINGIIYSKHNSATISNTVLQVSQGAFLNMPIYEVVNIKNEIKKLKNLGFWSIAFENEPDAKRWYNIDLKENIVMVFGSEGFGIKKKIKELCDFKAKIDMQGKINSLNVGASVAAVLFERLKQIKEQK